jgi:putative MATE family efflux protein
MKNQTQDLTQGSVFKGIVLFALPLLISNLLQQLYNFIDSAVVGTYSGDIALAAVGSTAAVINLLIGFFLGIATGTGVIYAMHFGAGDYPGLKKIADAAYIISLIAGVIITVFGITFAPQLLRMMDTPAEVMADSTIYLRIYLAGTIANLVYNVGAGMIRAVGDSTRPLIYLFISGAINFALDFLCVAWLKLGAGGAAIATVAAQIVSAVLVVRRMMKMPEEFRFRPLHMKLDKVAAWDVIRISVPCGLQGSMFNISNLLVQAKINSFGSVAMGGVTAYSKIDGFNYMPTMALGLACTTFVGQNVGAGKYDRVKKGVRTCLMLALGVSVIVSGCVVLFIDPMIGLFTDTPETAEFAKKMMWYMAPFAWTFVFSDTLGGALRGSGAAVPVTVISAMCICVFRVIWLEVMLSIIRDIRIVFMCYPISWLMSSAVMIIYYLRFSAVRRAMKSTGTVQEAK